MYYIEPDAAANAQADWFRAGLTQVGISQVKQAIKAFVYCILRAQVHVHSSILGTDSIATFWF